MSQFLQTNYWYSNTGTTITGCFATTNTTLQAVFSLKLRPDTTNESVLHSGPWAAGLHLQHEAPATAATQRAAKQQMLGRSGWPLTAPRTKGFSGQTRAQVQHSGPPPFFNCLMRGLRTLTAAAQQVQYNRSANDAQMRRYNCARA